MRPVGTPFQLTKHLSEERVLSYFEGALVTLYRNEAREPHVGLWVDQGEDRSQRWMLFRTTEFELTRYLRRKVSLREVMASTPDGYVILRDINHNGVTATWLVPLGDIPAEILPQEGALHDPDFEPPSDDVFGEESILIDGSWDMPKLSFLQRRYSQVYSIYALFGAADDNQHQLPDAAQTLSLAVADESEDFEDQLDYDDEDEEELALEPEIASARTIDRYRYRGGFIYKTVYDQLERMVPVAKRPKLKAVQYASPGFLRLRVDDEDAARTREAIRTFIGNASEVSEHYDRLHALIVAYGKWKKKNLDDAQGETSWDVEFRPYVETFATLVQLSLQAILTVTVNYRTAGILLASHYRKLNDLAKLQRDDIDIL